MALSLSLVGGSGEREPDSSNLSQEIAQGMKPTGGRITASPPNQVITPNMKPPSSNYAVLDDISNEEYKERVRRSQSSSSNNEDGDRLSDGEPLECEAKASYECNLIDHALVPRRLRSSLKYSTNPLNRQRTQSLYPPIVKKQLLSSKRTQPPLVNGAKKFKQSMRHEEFSKIELEVAEILSTLSSTFLAKEQINEDRGDALEIEATPSSLSGGNKEEGTEFLVPCTETKAENTFLAVEVSPKDTVKAAEPQHVLIEETQEIDLDLNGTPRVGFQRTGSYKNEQKENKCYGDSMRFSNRLGVPLHSQSFVHTNQKPTIEISTIGSASVEKDPHSMEWKSHKNPDVCPVSSNGQERSRMSCSSKATEPVLTENDLSTGKIPLIQANKSRIPRRCLTHVHISHAIKSLQTLKDNQRSGHPSNNVKIKEAMDPVARTSKGPAGSSNGLINSMKNVHEAKTRTAKPNKLVEKQVCDMTVPSSAPPHVMNSSGHLHPFYVQSHAQPHPMMHFSLPHGPNASSHYQDRHSSAAVATQQQYQLPHHLGKLYYGQHMANAAGVSMEQHQKMLWAQLAHYNWSSSSSVASPPEFQLVAGPSMPLSSKEKQKSRHSEKRILFSTEMPSQAQ